MKNTLRQKALLEESAAKISVAAEPGCVNRWTKSMAGGAAIPAWMRERLRARAKEALALLHAVSDCRAG